MFKIKDLFSKNNNKKINNEQQEKEKLIKLGFNIAKIYFNKNIATIKLVNKLPTKIYYPISSNQSLNSLRGEMETSNYKIIGEYELIYSEISHTLYVKKLISVENGEK
jgi:hypothetical protein